MNDDNTHRAPAAGSDVSRRAMLRLASGLGVAAFITMTGCGGRRTTGVATSTPTSGSMPTRPTKGIGSPIPPDPVLRSTPGTTYTPRPAPVTTAVGQPPRVMLRSQWAKGGPKTWLADPMRGIQRITIHHDAIASPSGSVQASIDRLESIRRGHLGHGWADIGYHFAIDPAGRVWEARPLDLQGAHVKDQNPHNLGIMLMGNFERSTPTIHAQIALQQTIAWAMASHRVPLRGVKTHREWAPTACPGRNLQSVMNSMRSDGSLRA
ncbi:MAG: peptidoglycan recognition family protein [Phycisphaerales bacterium]